MLAHPGPQSYSGQLLIAEGIVPLGTNREEALMTTLRVERRQRFTTVHRDTVNDSSLSWQARGLLIWLLDKPDDWRVNSTQIEHEAPNGREAVRAALRELERGGYIERKQGHDRLGRWFTESVVRERPVTASRRRLSDAGKLGANTKTVTEDCFPQTPIDEPVDNTIVPAWAQKYGPRS